MCKLYRLGSSSNDPDALLLSYEWDTFDNFEWRGCVDEFLREVAACDHEVTVESVPPHTTGEDRMEIVYSISGHRVAFMSDHLLSQIEISTENRQMLVNLWDKVGNKMGWAD